MLDREHSDGMGVDAAGNPVIDPSKNVLDLVEAAIQRQDDLRKSDARHVREIIRLHVAERKGEIKALHRAEKLRADYDQRLRKAEARRIDAIRAVDVSASQQAAKDAETRATALAGQVAASAEAMRNQVAAAASAATVSLGAALVPIQESIADLRRTQFEAAGAKTQIIEGRGAAEDMKPLVDAIQVLIEANAAERGARAQVVDDRSSRQGSNQSIGLWIAAAGVISAFIFGFAGIFITYMATKGP